MINLLDVACFSFAKPSKRQNEDAFLAPVIDKQSNIVFAISDGVGSHDGAGQASHCAINGIMSTLENQKFRIEDAFEKAKSAINDMSMLNPDFQDAATTLTIVQVTNSQVIVGHAGDCRAYFSNGKKLVQLTKDETRYQQLIDSGEVSRRQLNKHKKELSSVLTNALSSKIDLRFNIHTYDVKELSENNILNIILMSDGAYDHWHKRPRFSESTMSTPSAFSNSLRKRIEKEPTDDYSLVNVKLLML